MKTEQEKTKKTYAWRSMEAYDAGEKKRLGASALIIFVFIPLCLGLGIVLLHNKGYLPLSLLILAAVMLPFFLLFEHRKPKAREIVLIAMMSALTVAAHTFFHIFFPVQIGTALVILSGISLGPEAGFLIGALSRFVCNFYLGQGAWTPWQMFCWGLLGFLAGLSFNRGAIGKVYARSFRPVMGPVLAILFAELAAYIGFLLFPGGDETFFGWRVYLFGAIGLLAGFLLQRTRLPADGVTLCVFTFFTTLIVYGSIMNFASMLLSMNTPGAGMFGWDTLRALYISGLPYDLSHATTATVLVFLLGDPIITKLERIKIKYGIYRQ